MPSFFAAETLAMIVVPPHSSGTSSNSVRPCKTFWGFAWGSGITLSWLFFLSTSLDSLACFCSVLTLFIISVIVSVNFFDIISFSFLVFCSISALFFSKPLLPNSSLIKVLYISSVIVLWRQMI